MKFGRQDRSQEAMSLPPDAAPGAPTVEPDAPKTSHARPAPSRIGSVWIVSILFAVILLLLLIFILQNSQKAEISFFGANGHVPIGVALLLAAVFGILLVAVPGSARIVQLRMRDRRRRRLARKEPIGAPPVTSTPHAPSTDDQNAPAAPNSVDTPPAGWSPGGAPSPGSSVDQAPASGQTPTELDRPR